eukprot:4953502-Prymnesium_polylepis.2
MHIRGPFAPSEAICSTVKGVAPSIWRCETRSGKGNRSGRQDDQVHTLGQHTGALAELQTTMAVMRCNQ